MPAPGMPVLPVRVVDASATPCLVEVRRITGADPKAWGGAVSLVLRPWGGQPLVQRGQADWLAGLLVH